MKIKKDATDFQKLVWEEIKKIPKGKTATYKEIAARIGRPNAARAVANAAGANTQKIIIPCHRVIRNDGSIGGYRWGIKEKRRLLREEGVLLGVD